LAGRRARRTALGALRGGTAVEVDPALGLAARGSGGRDVDGAVDWFEELPEGCSGVVAQNSSFTTSEHRRHPAPVPTRSAMTHGVDATVEAM
jgi:hypothetical protein